ncbi:MAG TPA: hypothetical protein VGA66_17025 [Mycobacterium sp.]|jgi:hypothetical protein
MRKAVHRTVPIVVAGAFAAALFSAGAASADAPSVGFSTGSVLMLPFPESDMMCEVMFYCDTGLDLVVTGGNTRDDPEFGGGFLTPNPALDDN